jgi:hypothetical protein
MGLPFVPLAGRARWATIFLLAALIVDVLTIGTDLGQMMAIDKYLDGRNGDAGAVTLWDDRQSLVALLEFLALLAGGILFIRWFHAAYRNVTSLAPAEVRFKPGWAIGAWFVPFLCLWRPKQIADEIWHVAELQPALADDRASSPGTTTLMTLWWATWIIGTFLGNFSGRLLFGDNTLADIRNHDKLDIAAGCLDIVAAVLAILVVRRITARLAGTTAPPEAALGTAPESGFAT